MPVVPSQETLVLACHVVPAILLIISWMLLVWGVYRSVTTKISVLF